MILRFSKQPDSPHSQILRKAGQKKAEPNNVYERDGALLNSRGLILPTTEPLQHLLGSLGLLGGPPPPPPPVEFEN
jgi:hypothetical protein